VIVSAWSLADHRDHSDGGQATRLPLRAEINVVGYLARKPEGAERA
jgi:hypothetical protein